MARSTKPKISLNLPDKPDPTRGGGGWPLKLDHVDIWAWKLDLFTPEEMDAIIQIGTSTELIKGKTVGLPKDEKVRNSGVQFLFPNETTNWIFGRLSSAIQEVNDNHFGFDLTGIDEGLQFTRYSAPGEHYTWHMDRGFAYRTRKLSISVQLNDSSEYTGGELQFKFSKDDLTVEKKRGVGIFFPSYTLHRVKKVTSGTRYSLVAWVNGPPFK
jgi:PKHD-type hydroxylase